MTLSPFSVVDAAESVRDKLPATPEVHMVLGSGLSALADGLVDPVIIPFGEVPGFSRAGVVGHAGHLAYGELEGKRVLMQAGRFHFYEGHPAEMVVAPIRLAAALGARTVILTNAAGGIGKGLLPGSLMLLDDHLNLMGRSPLAGPVQGSEERFPDMSEPYDSALQARAMGVAEALGIPLRRGTYAAVLGPSYETPAEIRYLQGVGADAVGMSTVPEAITARALGMKVMGFSLITNLAAGMGQASLDHQEVLDVGKEAGEKLQRLIRALLAEI
jgi:purine-nucleoside phosphorylase